MKTYRIRKDRTKKFAGQWVVLTDKYTVLARYAKLTEALLFIECGIVKIESELISSVTIKVKQN